MTYHSKWNCTLSALEIFSCPIVVTWGHKRSSEVKTWKKANFFQTSHVTYHSKGNCTLSALEIFSWALVVKWGHKRFSPVILALRASLVLMYWPFGQVRFRCIGLRASLVLMYWPSGSVWSWCTGRSGKFISVILARWASLVLSYWPFGPV